MVIRLNPELSAVVEQDVLNRGYTSAEEYVADAVELLHEQDGWRSESLEEVRAGIEEAWQQAERGELISMEELERNMGRMKAEWIRRQGPS